MDLFPDGSQVLGGCALNVAWHLKGLELSPILISRVGSDLLGSTVISKIDAWNLRTDQIQVDTEHVTGTVTVSFDSNGEPVYKSTYPTAFDFISEIPRRADNE